ncbi:hypothetical protein AOCH_007833, partial [Aspergillus ochraceoroseus]
RARIWVLCEKYDVYDAPDKRSKEKYDVYDVPDKRSKEPLSLLSP